VNQLERKWSTGRARVRKGRGKKVKKGRGKRVYRGRKNGKVKLREEREREQA
jgi:hypothetical protein